MKSSKIILIILSICVLLTSFFGCSTQTKNNNQEFEVLEIGSFDDLDGGKHISEYSVWAPNKLNYHQDSTAPKEGTVVFNGITYSGQYQRSSTSIPNTYISHRYKGANVFFELNGSTGELSYISWMGRLVNISFPNLTYRIKVIPIKRFMSFFPLELGRQF